MQRDVSSARRLAARVVAEHDQRSLTGVVVLVDDPGKVVEESIANLSGFRAGGEF